MENLNRANQIFHLYSTIILDIDYKHNHDLISSITTTAGVDLEDLDGRGPTFRRRTRLF